MYVDCNLVLCGIIIDDVNLGCDMRLLGSYRLFLSAACMIHVLHIIKENEMVQTKHLMLIAYV